MMKWGVMPHFVKQPIINARKETIDIKPTFKNPFFNKRCIIPVTGFYEWQDVNNKKIKKEF